MTTNVFASESMTCSKIKQYDDNNVIYTKAVISPKKGEVVLYDSKNEVREFIKDGVYKIDGFEINLSNCQQSSNEDVPDYGEFYEFNYDCDGSPLGNNFKLKYLFEDFSDEESGVNNALVLDVEAKYMTFHVIVMSDCK